MKPVQMLSAKLFRSVVRCYRFFVEACERFRLQEVAHLLAMAILRGSWDLVTGVINKVTIVTILIITYNPN